MNRVIEKTMNRLLPARLGMRAKAIVAVVAFWGVVALWVDAEVSALSNPSYTTGYLLIAAVFFLASYQWRKKLPTIGLGSTHGWMQFHVTVGWATIGLFLFHVGVTLPTGGLDTLLYLAFVLTATSGVYGLYLSKTVPGKLAAMKTEAIYDRAPWKRRQIADQVQQHVLQTATRGDVLAKFYQSSLAEFFERPRSPWYYLRPSGVWRRKILTSAKSLDRYLDIEDRELRDRLCALVNEKDDLDYQCALQFRLKAWLFAHIGATYGLLILSAYHALVVHAFGGLR